MAECSSCGAPLTPAQKFCRACGASVGREQPMPPPTLDGSCLQCGEPLTPGPKFCRQCGASDDRVAAGVTNATLPVQPARQGTNAGLIAGLSVAACLALGAAVYFAWPLMRAPEGPDHTAVQAALAQQLPPYVHLESLSVGAVQRDKSTTPPIFDVQFSAAPVLTSSLYESPRVENDVTFIAERAARGTPLPLTGKGRFRREQDRWKYDLSLTPHPLMAAVPREVFGNKPTIVEGSAEEREYVDARARADEARWQAEVQAAEAAARLRADQARRDAEQRARLEALRAEEIRLAQERQAQSAIAARQRAEAERVAQAARDADARRAAEAEAERHRPPAPPADAAPSSTGTVPKGTEVNVRLATRLRSDAVHVEDRFTTTTLDPIVVGGRIIVPAGATLRGVIAAVQPSGRTARKAR